MSVAESPHHRSHQTFLEDNKPAVQNMGSQGFVPGDDQSGQSLPLIGSEPGAGSGAIIAFPVKKPGSEGGAIALVESNSHLQTFRIEVAAVINSAPGSGYFIHQF
jgi:hypothetical protein